MVPNVKSGKAMAITSLIASGTCVVKVKATGCSVAIGAFVPVPIFKDDPVNNATGTAGDLIMVVAPILFPPASVTAAVLDDRS